MEDQPVPIPDRPSASQKLGKQSPFLSSKQSDAPHENEVPVDARNVSFDAEKYTSSPFEQFSSILESTVFRYPRDPGRLHGRPVHTRPQAISLPWTEIERVWLQYFALRNVQLPDKIAEALVCHTFNNWMYSDAQLLVFVKHMFVSLHLPTSLNFPLDVFETWLLAVYRRYNDVPFHNFKHAFTVTQMMYSLIKRARLELCFSPLDLLVLMFSAISHDLDHPGFTNSYQVNASTWLALRYNDCSPLENHHCAVAFDLLGHPSTNFTSCLKPADWKWFRKAVIKCILATDMANHSDQMAKFKPLLAQLSTSSRPGAKDHAELRTLFTSDPELRLFVMMMLLKTCDISNEIRPIAVADLWLECLLEEFFYQANAEKQLGLPVAPFMDPEKVVRSTGQIAFLQGTLVPLLESIVSIFPELKELELSAKDRISYYSLLKKQQDEEDAVSTTPLQTTESASKLPNPSPGSSTDPSRVPTAFSSRTPIRGELRAGSSNSDECRTPWDYCWKGDRRSTPSVSTRNSSSSSLVAANI